MQWGVTQKRLDTITLLKLLCIICIEVSLFPSCYVKQYHERSEKQKEVYQTHLATHTAETAPTDPPVAPQTPAVDAPQTVAQATKHTLQVEMTATESEVGLPVAMIDSQEQKHPGPAPTHPKLVVGSIL